MHPPALLFAGTLVCLPLTHASVLIGPSGQSATIAPGRAPTRAPGTGSQVIKTFETTLQDDTATCETGGNLPLPVPPGGEQISAIPEPSAVLTVGALLVSGLMIRQRRK